ncbi:MAG: hypothetical protein A2083_05870 [Gemmatimonadetes bacterium GWC2_71_9]|nr:MAG: hypothetical protein A2083_05870 [Gemmatimonadetes bacterium GWC2_71_9]
MDVEGGEQGASEGGSVQPVGPEHVAWRGNRDFLEQPEAIGPAGQSPDIRQELVLPPPLRLQVGSRSLSLTPGRGKGGDHLVGHGGAEPRAGERQLVRADRRDALAHCQLREAVELGAREPCSEQVDVVDPDEPLDVSVVHHRMNTGQEQRVDGSGGARVGAERGDGRRGGCELVIAEEIGEGGLGADLPVEIEGVTDAERVLFSKLKLAKQELAVAVVRGRVADPSHDAADGIGLLQRYEKVGVAAGPEARGLVDCVRERRALQQDRVDISRREGVEHRDQFSATEELPRRSRSGLARQFVAEALRPADSR